MKLDTSKVKSANFLSVGDVVVIEHKGIGKEESFIVVNLNEIGEGYVGVSLTGEDLLLGGVYHSLEALIQDLRSETLIERISVYPYTQYILSLELKK